MGGVLKSLTRDDGDLGVLSGTIVDDWKNYFVLPHNVMLKIFNNSVQTMHLNVLFLLGKITQTDELK